MSDVEFRSLIAKAKVKTSEAGSLNALWDVIADGEAILRGERSILSRSEVERLLLQAL